MPGTVTQSPTAYGPLGDDPRRSQVEHDLQTFGPNTTENTLYTFSIRGGTAVGGHEYRMRLWGEIQNNSGGNTDLTFRVKRNGATEASLGVIVVPTSADFRGWEVEFSQFMDNDFSLNLLVNECWVGPVVTSGIPQGDNIANRGRWRQLTLTAADWATDVTFALTAQFSVNSPTIRRHGADMTTILTTPG